MLVSRRFFLAVSVAALSLVSATRSLCVALGFPKWLPIAEGVPPTIYADFTNGHYWASGKEHPSCEAWLAALEAAPLSRHS